MKGAGLLQSAWGAGYFLAAGIGALLSHRSWRVMFFVGLVPALVALFGPWNWWLPRPAAWVLRTQPTRRLAEPMAVERAS